MKLLLVAEYKSKKFLESNYELIAFADKLKADYVMFGVGDETDLPKCEGKIYLADSEKAGEYNPSLHKKLIAEVMEKEKADFIVLPHTSYGWDLAPRLSAELAFPQVTEVVDVDDDNFILPACNGKLWRKVSTGGKGIITIQGGAFNPENDYEGTPEVINLEVPSVESKIQFEGYEKAEAVGVDLTKAEIIVSAGRGVGKKENVENVRKLAEALGGELGASRPVVDSEWVEHSHQVGTTGQTVAPKLYVACGISGAIQHLAGMKKSDFILAVNTDKDAPIAEVADVLVVADVNQFAPALAEKISSK
ncbi:electron transfer flavoprotein subunit alpha/FixB family protein [Flexistipes sp.]|uniref:electron transfer flavoprotein subunit alpha/FixB family protein n=1 Tax=Flexistipes sp. TaxID=3088135 RepID=UPI002E24C50F|nr:electron transfer flavoprotein subunit alpha/FixB family protein [Flexistipes sp.]